MTPAEALKEIVKACNKVSAGKSANIFPDWLALVLQDFDDRLRILEREAGLR